MGMNVLGARKTRAAARATGLPVVWAVTQSHHEAGRYVLFTTADHRHGWWDRGTGEWEYDDDPCRQSSCRILFAFGPTPEQVAQRADGLRRNPGANILDRP